MRAWLVLLAFVLAGCGTDGPTTTTTTTTTTGPEGVFDGAATWRLAHDLVYASPGVLRDRTPQSAGHDATAVWLASHMDLPGWTVSYENFTGRDVAALGWGQAAPWSPPNCNEADQEAFPDLRFTNLVATWGDGRYLLGAHWDAKEDAEHLDGTPANGPVPAANDGASGVAVLLHLMRLVSEGDVVAPHGLRIVLFDGEDGFEDCHPLAGSIHHARTQPAPARMLLLDMVGDADARFPRESRSLAADPHALELLWEHGNRLLPENFVDDERSVMDDHVPFIEEGVPAVDLIDYARDDGRFGFPPYWHTTQDTPDRLDPAMLAAVGDIVVALLLDERLWQE